MTLGVGCLFTMSWEEERRPEHPVIDEQQVAFDISQESAPCGGGETRAGGLCLSRLRGSGTGTGRHTSFRVKQKKFSFAFNPHHASPCEICAKLN